MQLGMKIFVISSCESHGHSCYCCRVCFPLPTFMTEGNAKLHLDLSEDKCIFFPSKFMDPTFYPQIHWRFRNKGEEPIRFCHPGLLPCSLISSPITIRLLPTLRPSDLLLFKHSLVHLATCFCSSLWNALPSNLCAVFLSRCLCLSSNITSAERAALTYPSNVATLLAS